MSLNELVTGPLHQGKPEVQVPAPSAAPEGPAADQRPQQPCPEDAAVFTADQPGRASRRNAADGCATRGTLLRIPFVDLLSTLLSRIAKLFAANAAEPAADVDACDAVPAVLLAAHRRLPNVNPFWRPVPSAERKSTSVGPLCET